MNVPRVLLESGRNRLIVTRHGNMLYDRLDVGVGKFLEAYGEYFEDEIDVLRKCCGPGGVVVDAGANIGTHTLALAQIVGPGGRVFAFEPQGRVCQLLAANVALNGIDHVECLRAALSDADGEMPLGNLPANAQANFGGATLTDLAGHVRTPVYALDNFLADVNRLQLIKLDVEGMELQVLRGAAGLLQKHHPAIYAENNRPAQSTALIAFLKESGYRVYWHLPPHFRADNFYQNPTPLMPNALFEPPGGGEFLESIGVAINILALPSAVAVNGLREVTELEEHPLKREYSKSFVSS
jgi:FkbM family methyltransferase